MRSDFWWFQAEAVLSSTETNVSELAGTVIVSQSGLLGQITGS